MMLGDKISGEEAEKMGMVYKVIDESTFAEDAYIQAHSLAQMPTQALAYTKTALNNSMNATFYEQLLEEDRLQRKAAVTPDYKEGIQAFVEKRKAIFTGRP